MNKDDFKLLFASKQREMAARLQEIRQTFAHPGGKGARAEDIFREFLHEYLPRRLGVGHGEIVDSFGERSGETDIVIVTEDHPFTFSPHSHGLFFVEGVCGAGEAKMTVDTGKLNDAIEKSSKFKSLESCSGEDTTQVTQEANIQRYYDHPPFFLISFKSDLTLQTIVDHIKHDEPGDGTVNAVLDAVFVLDRGWAINFGDGEETFCYQDESGERGRGWIWQDSRNVLLKFVGWLSAVMPRYVRCQSILTPYLLRGYTFD